MCLPYSSIFDTSSIKVHNDRDGFTLSLLPSHNASSSAFHSVAYAPVAPSAVAFRRGRLNDPQLLPRAEGAVETQRMYSNKWRGPAFAFATSAPRRAGSA